MWIKNPDGTVLVPDADAPGRRNHGRAAGRRPDGHYHVFLNPDTFNTGVGHGARLHGAAGHRSTTWPSTARPTRCRSRSPARTARSGSRGNAGQEVSINLASSVADTDCQILKPNGNELDSGSLRHVGRLHRAVHASDGRARTSSCSTRRASLSEPSPPRCTTCRPTRPRRERSARRRSTPSARPARTRR